MNILKVLIGVALCAALFVFIGCPDGNDPTGGPGGSDTSAPVITLAAGTETITVELGIDSADPGVTVVDDDSEYAGTVTATPSDAAITVSGTTISTTTVGVYTITYSAPADAAGNEAVAVVRTVMVVDTTNPVITLTDGDLVIEVGETFMDPGFVLVENDPNYAGMVTPVITNNAGGATVTAIDTAAIGVYTITYTAETDAAGNDVTQVTRMVRVVPVGTAPPVITLMGAATITIELGVDFMDPGATVTDNAPYTGTVTATATGSGITLTGTTISTTAVGEYTITYSAPNDTNDNEALDVIRTVTVVDTTAPVITLTGANPLLIEVGGMFDDPGAVANDNDPAYGTDVAVVGVITNDAGGATVTAIDTAAIGEYTVTYSASDATSNTAEVTRMVRVIRVVDRDNDRLIDINNLEDLNAIRYNLAGTSYRASADGIELLCGTDAATACTGYELMRDLDFAVDASYASGTVNADWIPDVTDPDAATNMGWEPIGTDASHFSGSFFGNRFAISNLYVRRDGAVGLFGVSSGTIEGIGVVDVRVYGRNGDDSVGGLVGSNFGGTITASYATGPVDGRAGTDAVGGLVGRNNIGGTITTSYATGNVNGGAGNNDDAGGLVGNNVQGAITASYATGNVNGGVGNNDDAGGLVARNTVAGTGTTTGTITASYATGNANGGGGSSSAAGALVSAGVGSATTSYGFGAVSNADFISDARSGDTSSVGNACGITQLNSSTTPAKRWSVAQWNFGIVSEERPVVTYSDGTILPGQTSRGC